MDCGLQSAICIIVLQGNISGLKANFQVFTHDCEAW